MISTAKYLWDEKSMNIRGALMSHEMKRRMFWALFGLVLLGAFLTVPCCWSQQEGDMVGEAGGDVSEIEAKLDQPVGPINIAGVKWRDFLNVLSKQTGVTFIPSPKVTTNVDVNLSKTTLRSILDEFLPLHGLAYQITPTAVKVITEGEVVPPDVVLLERTFLIQYTTVEKIKNAIQLLKSPEGQIVADPTAKQIIVKDTADVLMEMEALVQKLDVPTTTRIFKIRYVDTKIVMDQIKEILSGEKGSIQEDPKTGTLIITDIPENLERAAKIIEEIDVKTDLTVIKINFADPKEVIKMAKEFLGEEAYIEYDERTNQIIIDDIPSRVEKVRELIRRLDEPEKVVYIEAEIVDFSLTDKMELGFDWEIGKSVNIHSVSEAIWLEPLLKVINGSASMTYLQPENYKVAIKAMEDTGHAKVLASPRVLVKNNEGAKLQVGTEEPYSVRSTRGYGGGYRDDYGGGGDYYSQRTRDVGIILDVEVKINEAGYVEMDIRLENSSAELVNLSGVENSGLRVRKSEVETITPAKDGRTVVVGGLIEESKNSSVAGLPLLSRIPLIGWLFGKYVKTNSRHKLLLLDIVLRPFVELFVLGKGIFLQNLRRSF